MLLDYRKCTHEKTWFLPSTRASHMGDSHEVNGKVLEDPEMNKAASLHKETKIWIWTVFKRWCEEIGFIIKGDIKELSFKNIFEEIQRQVEIGKGRDKERDWAREREWGPVICKCLKLWVYSSNPGLLHGWLEQLNYLSHHLLLCRAHMGRKLELKWSYNSSLGSPIWAVGMLMGVLTAGPNSYPLALCLDIMHML